MQTWNNCGAVCRLFKISSSVKIFNNLVSSPSSPSMVIANIFNETSLCTLENNGTKCVTSTTGIIKQRNILNMERVMKVMIQIIVYFDRARYFEQSTYSPTIVPCLHFIEQQPNLSKWSTKFANIDKSSKRRLHRDVGLLLATHQAVTKHSSGLLIKGSLVSALKSSVTRSKDWDSNSS